MKIFTRTLLAAMALSFAAAPIVQAQDYRSNHKPGYSSSWKKHEARKRHHWRKGERYADWKRRAPVQDYHRHGLRKPGRGQQWVKVDDSYLLMSVATGLILGIAAAR